MTQVEPQQVHSLLGASSAYRWMACAASIQRSKGIPRTSNKYADLGSAAHALGEMCLLDNSDPFDHIDHVFAEYPDYPVTEKMAEDVSIYVNAVRQAHNELGAHALLDVEKRFSLDWLHPQFYGTNDACLVDAGNILWVFDYKNGYGYVDHLENPQLMYYALGAMYNFFGLFKEIRMTIVQPNAEGEAVRTYCTDIVRLNNFSQELLEAAKATEVENPTVKVGSHCKFCPANGTEKCPESSEHKFELAKQRFAEYMQPEKKELVLPAPEDMPLEWRKKILEAAEDFEHWINSVKNYTAIKAINNGEIPEGFKLVKQNKHRKYIDQKAAEETAKELLGDKIYAPRKLLSPAQLEKLAKTDEIKDKLETLWEKPEGDLILVKSSDKRKAQEPKTAVNVFKEYTAEIDVFDDL